MKNILTEKFMSVERIENAENFVKKCGKRNNRGCHGDCQWINGQCEGL